MVLKKYQVYHSNDASLGKVQFLLQLQKHHNSYYQLSTILHAQNVIKCFNFTKNMLQIIYIFTFFEIWFWLTSEIEILGS